MPRYRALVITLLALSAAPAHADLGNRNYFPFGERAATMANAGITSPYGEAAYYNPANLTRIGYPSISVSGSTYLRFELSADPLLVLQGEDQPFSASGFVAIPSTVISTYKVGGFWLATAILVPEAIEYKNRTTFKTPDLAISVLQQRSSESLWIGGSIARELSPGFSVGLSLFGHKESEGSTSFVRVQQGLPPAPLVSVFEQTTNEDTSVINASAILGAYYEVSPELGLGLRVQSPTIKITGSSDIYQATLQTDMMSTMPMSNELAFDGVDVSRPSPADVGLGVSVHPTPKLELVVDASLQLPGTYTILDDPMIGTRTVKARTAPRASLAGELEVGSKKWLRFGALYNRSSVPRPTNADDPSQENYVGATLGFSFQKDRTVTSLGVFGLQSKSILYVEGADPARLSDARTRAYGGVLSVSYRL